MSFWKEKLDPPEVKRMFVERDLNNLKNEHVNGLDEVIQGFITAKDIGIYDDLKVAYKVKKIIDPTYEEIISYNMPDDSVFTLASRNMSHSILKLPLRDMISFSDIFDVYRFLGILYYCRTQDPSDLEDFLEIYKSGLDEKLFLYQNDFDKNSNYSKTSPEYFIKLKKVNWKNNEVKKLFYKLENLRTSIIYPTSVYIKFAGLTNIEHYFIQVISACSAVRDNREYINKNDIIVGYKTYLKLLKTDITKYKARSNFKIESKNDDNGYLVCDKCNEYYELQPGESPEDFSDECECGGKLKYYDNIDWLFKETLTES